MDFNEVITRLEKPEKPHLLKKADHPCGWPAICLSSRKDITQTILGIAEVDESAAYQAYVSISHTSKTPKELC